MGSKKLEMRILNAHIPFPISNLWYLKKKIELGPEKWEMGFKRGFSRLKVYPQIASYSYTFGQQLPTSISIRLPGERMREEEEGQDGRSACAPFRANEMKVIAAAIDVGGNVQGSKVVENNYIMYRNYT